MSCDKPGGPGRVLAPLDPAVFKAPGMLAALAAHDIATVYRGLPGFRSSWAVVTAESGA